MADMFNSGLIIKCKPIGNHTTISNSIFKLKLSAEAYGLYLWLQSKPPNWKVYKSNLHHEFNNGKERIARAFAELEAVGLIHRTAQMGKNNLLQGWNYVVDNEPNKHKPKDHVEPRVSGNPEIRESDVRKSETRKPDVRKTATNNKDYTNKEVNKKNSSNKASPSVVVDFEKFKKKFELWTEKYPGVKRHVDTEWNYFMKKTNDWMDVIHLLDESLDLQLKEHKRAKAADEFVPGWPYLRNYLAGRGWEATFLPPKHEKGGAGFVMKSLTINKINK